MLIRIESRRKTRERERERERKKGRRRETTNSKGWAKSLN